MKDDEKPDYCSILQQQGGIHAYLCWDNGGDELTEAQRLELLNSFGISRAAISDGIDEHIVKCESCARAYEAVEDIRRTLENINER